MIYDINGKRLAFALEWRLLMSSGGASALATEQAQIAKARWLWHDGKASYAGLLLPTERVPAGNASMYAAAIALLRMPRLPSEALFVHRTPDSNYVVIGVKDGRPRKGFDQSGLSYDAAKELYERFGAMCGESGFAAVGDSTIPFMSEATALSLDELALLANESCSLKAPSNATRWINIGLVTVALALGVTCGPWFYHTYISPPTVQEQKTPGELYHDFLSEHAADPVQLADGYGDWYQWVRSSLKPRYGGWALQTVDCDFQNPGSQSGSYVAWDGKPSCRLTFLREVKSIATNRTFIEAIPDDWRQSAAYAPASDQWIVALRPALGGHVTLREFLSKAAMPPQRDVDFVSTLQHSGELVSVAPLASPSPFVLPPGVPRADIPGPVFMAVPWKVSGEFHYSQLLSRFPPYAMLSKATLTIGTSSASTNPFSVTLVGSAITRY
ncbi:hypothetical protein [Burkholderia aenigmatica]|uniref:hypothetical protein n=1 Tax=Burkholderia aenigmatica TaxID=2015348 RepID=UPI00264E7F93|nr:hypothetical protein [Burkholderia aenigmatica]MDN7880133.1 hypothetical protein [Burkholderia aenigmatica]